MRTLHTLFITLAAAAAAAAATNLLHTRAKWGEAPAIMNTLDNPDADSRRIEAEIIVPATREEVWQAWTTTEGLTTFFAPNAHVELRRGGPFEVYFLADQPYGLRGSEGCTILSWVENEMLSFTWNAPPTWPAIRARRTFIVLQFSDAPGGGTRVQLTNDGYGEGEEWNEVLEYFRNAWPHVLGNLQKRFESGPLWPDDQRMQLALPRRSNYIYTIQPVRADLLETGPTPEESKIISEHAAYLRDLVASNHVILAGPSFEPAQYPQATPQSVPLEGDAVGIVIFEAESDEDARRIMENDPAVRAGIFKARVNPISISLRRP